MNKRLITLTLLAALLLTAGIAAAQGNGNGNGNGAGGPNAEAGSPRGNGYRYGLGTVDIVEADTGQPWNRQQQASRGQMGIYATLPPAVEGPLPETVVAAMTDGINDERMALVVYDAIIEQFGEIRPFVNIREAEARHLASWEFMFARYGLELPAEPTVDIPAFTSVAEACQIAVDAEITNAGLYDNMIVTFADYPDLLQVATALRNASEYSHLPALQNCAP
ncbi:MAG: hypothetical protein CL610_21100 [Anaerolineaceae bacterium]|nr:hypothetical protein [Anaerolineaceae bacterium]